MAGASVPRTEVAEFAAVTINGSARPIFLGSKRAVDITVALFLLLLTFSLVMLCAAIVRLTSRGPAFYSHTRLGRGARPFRLFKLRTMTYDCERTTGARWATAADPRVTRFGRLLRRTHLDNLPQLWNVLKGDMSLVGPRPERPEFVPVLESSIPGYRRRLATRPGLTGMAQAYCPSVTGVPSIRRKLEFDLYYVRHAGWWLDVRLFIAAWWRLFGLPRELARRVALLPHRSMIESLGREA
jgi:lipopolysaccharide/colanic/teichoic acid biosynthesis glycosyltransferase